MKRLVFTGGHHTSALEVAKALKNKGWEIVWFGHRHSMWGDKSDSAEYTEVTAAGIKFYDLRAGKFYRTFHPLKLIRIPLGFFEAFSLLLSLKPSGIVSFGGYLAVPTVLAGWVLGIPSITHEQTVVSGWANKFIALFVRKVALAWPDSVQHYPPHKSVIIGLPLRSEIIKIRKPLAKRDRKIETENRKLVYITGGKQGSQTINKVVFAALPELLTNYRVIHQTGNLDYSTALSYQKNGYECFSFDSDKAVSALSRAAVVISRAGAHIVYELGFLNKPCVLIPISRSSHNEQLLNAQILERNRQAVILPESKLSPQSLVSSIKQALQLKPGILMLPVDASEKLIQLIEQEFA